MGSKLGMTFGSSPGQKRVLEEISIGTRCYFEESAMAVDPFLNTPILPCIAIYIHIYTNEYN